MKEETTEIWKDIVGYENLYQVSSHGAVRSLKRTIQHKFSGTITIRERILKHRISKNGYPYVDLCNHDQKRYYVHRLVLTAFLPNTYNKPCINHKNSVRTDNRIENLEWCTYSENELHWYREVGRALSEKQINAFKKVREERIAQHATYLTYNGQTLTTAQWARVLGISPDTIYGRCKRKLAVEEILSDINSRNGKPLRKVLQDAQPLQ